MTDTADEDFEDIDPAALEVDVGQIAATSSLVRANSVNVRAELIRAFTDFVRDGTRFEFDAEAGAPDPRIVDEALRSMELIARHSSDICRANEIPLRLGALRREVYKVLTADAGLNRSPSTLKENPLQREIFLREFAAEVEEFDPALTVLDPERLSPFLTATSGHLSADFKKAFRGTGSVTDGYLCASPRIEIPIAKISGPENAMNAYTTLLSAAHHAANTALRQVYGTTISCPENEGSYYDITLDPRRVALTLGRFLNPGGFVLIPNGCGADSIDALDSLEFDGPPNNILIADPLMYMMAAGQTPPHNIMHFFPGVRLKGNLLCAWRLDGKGIVEVVDRNKIEGYIRLLRAPLIYFGNESEE